MAGLQAHHADAPGPGARGARARRDLPPERSRRDAAQARRGGAEGAQGTARTARRRSTPPTTASTTATSRTSWCARVREQGGLFTVGGSRQLEGEDRGAGAHQLQGRRGLQARQLGAGTGDAAGAEHPRELRPQVDGLQQRPLHPHPLPGDEPRLRRPRLLLRRPGVPARDADQGAAVEGLRARARPAHQPRPQRPGRASGRPVPVPERHATRTPRSSRSGTRKAAAQTPHHHGRVRPHVPSGDHQRRGGR